MQMWDPMSESENWVCAVCSVRAFLSVQSVCICVCIYGFVFFFFISVFFSVNHMH